MERNTNFEIKIGRKIIELNRQSNISFDCDHFHIDSNAWQEVNRFTQEQPSQYKIYENCRMTVRDRLIDSFIIDL